MILKKNYHYDTSGIVIRRLKVICLGNGPINTRRFGRFVFQIDVFFSGPSVPSIFFFVFLLVLFQIDLYRNRSILDGIIIYAVALYRQIIEERYLWPTVAVQVAVYFVLKEQQKKQQQNNGLLDLCGVHNSYLSNYL